LSSCVGVSAAVCDGGNINKRRTSFYSLLGDHVTHTPCRFVVLVGLPLLGVIHITKVEGGLEGEFDPDGDFKVAKRKLSWLANVSSNPKVILTEFDNLITKEKMEEDDKFEDHINPNTLATTEVIGDAGLKSLQEDEIIQLERRGFFRVDRPFVNADKPLILYMVPDGKQKAMSGQSGKLAHH
jgi:glutamyl-tRNA synthetase